jgi:small subunit ribosomal protein S9
MAGQQYTEGNGRRKTSTARVRLISGSGKMTVNDKPAEEYFTRYGDMKSILGPLEAAGLQDKLDITVKVQGGGVTGQTEAVRHGIARALVLMDPELRPAMRTGGFMTRDARAKERKKPGLKRARKAPTYTKR